MRSVEIKRPEGYDVEGLVATDKNWLVRFRKPGPGGPLSEAAHSLFEVDPANGQLLKEYRVQPPDASVSCFFDEVLGRSPRGHQVDSGTGHSRTISPGSRNASR